MTHDSIVNRCTRFWADVQQVAPSGIPQSAFSNKWYALEQEPTLYATS